MLNQTLSNLHMCSPDNSSASFNTSDILKTCYYQITNKLPKQSGSQINVHVSSSSRSPKVQTKIDYRSKSNMLPTLLLSSNCQDSMLSIIPKNTMEDAYSMISTVKDEVICSSRQSSFLRHKQLLQSLQTQKQVNPRVQKENKIRKKIQHRKIIAGLSKQQRYFEAADVCVNPQMVDRIGLYQAGQLFKVKNISTNLQELKVVAHKHEFNPVRAKNPFDLFVTNVIPESQFCLDAFVDKELNKHPLEANISIPEVEQALSSRPYTEALPQPYYTNSDGCQCEVERSTFFVTVHNYTIVQDQQYKLFKVKNLVNWGTVQLNLQKIIRCLKEHKIQYLKFKAQTLTTWQGKQMSKGMICQQLGLSNALTTSEKIQRQVEAFVDRLKVAVIKKKIERRACLAKWVCERMTGIHQMKRNRQIKLQYARTIQQQLRDNPDWDVEIFLPSFSVDSFRRNTTQYIEWFQNQYHCLWERSKRPLILILPTLNQHLLSLLQSKIKLLRPATIITPQIYSVFPANLSLAAQVYFSFQTLSKIERAIGGRRAVILGGQYSQGVYQSLISDYLQAPILRSVRTHHEFEEEKLFFREAQIAVPTHSLIPANISFDKLLELLADLFEKHQGEKTWVIKISGQFRGRGIATFRINPGKYIKGALKCTNGTRQALIETLRSSLRLKLRVNFQNSVYVVEQFLNALRKQGGIIQQEIEALSSYELCFFKLRNCQLKSIFRVYGTNFNNKLWLLCPPDPPLANLAFSIGLNIQQQERYFGHVSVTICKTKHGFMGLDLKFGQTPAAGIAILAERMQQNIPNITEDQTYSISQLPTRRVDIQMEGYWPSPINFNELVCLFMPAIPFTDIEELNKAKLIEQLMQHCWTNRHLKLGNPAKLYLSMGLDFGGVLFGRDLKRLKRQAGELVRDLAEKCEGLKEYRGKEMVRDVFEFGEVIRAISQIRLQDVNIS